MDEKIRKAIQEKIEGLLDCYKNILEEFNIKAGKSQCSIEFKENDKSKNIIVHINIDTAHSGKEVLFSKTIEYKFKRIIEEGVVEKTIVPIQFEFERLEDKSIIENMVLEQMCSYLENSIESRTVEICDKKGKESSKDKDNFEKQKSGFLDQIYYNISEYLLMNFYISVDCINEISQKTHERAECLGCFCFSSSFKDEEIVQRIETEEDIKFCHKDARILRRLVETTKNNENFCVGLQLGNISDSSISEPEYVVAGYVKPKLSDKLYLNIIGLMKWKLFLGEEALFTYAYGKYNKEKAISDILEEELFVKKFPKLKEAVAEYICALKKSSEVHGALMIFSNDDGYINDMVNKNRGIKVSESYSLFDYFYKDSSDDEKRIKQLLINVCIIDGAVVFDLEGRLKAYGVILDGLAIQNGDIARGSRYNSTKAFVDYYGKEKSIEKQYFAIVLSEDGDITCIKN